MDKKEIKKLTREILKEMKDEKKRENLHNTRLLLENYNILKSNIEDVKGDITPILNKIEELEMEKDKIFIKSMVKTKMRTAKMLAYVDEAKKIIEEEFKIKKEYYKFRAFEMFYFEEKDNEKICKELNCGKNSPKSWRDEIINKMNILLWGIEAFGI
ncbi:MULTISPECIES: hypothetical protein [unclassified Clostridioides]|uniref:hypothetical protein n=1 Tax=unclassified Clostridioides TaxID=2635829 RepID=UPI001D119966|nr:hypothetical protein [Clostridioides sp. ES-S-0001-02]MCC0670812.1 hypothetical protein [Clostridioides sp. ES-S-0145-01]UDN56770.1 hypothetical protein JJC01_11295 [Clostridioides sp. ES-S-0010-02]